MRQPPSQPVVDDARVLRLDLSCGVSPPFNQLPLKLTVDRLDPPVARRPLDSIAGFFEDSLGNGPRIRPRCRAPEALVCLLMQIHQLSDHLIFRFDRIAR
jgi:hypothetical protein